ncbi:RNA polymerase factor sigma-54 [Marinobacter alexandrii]|uniref:RNA polymerase factor sigma-54 n=1 Tax=Marinobacter alexandrii TaxID=2570351 RepID=UPI003296C82E
MKQSLQLKLGQQLTMTPQLQQAIKLLQLSTLDLQQEIQLALDSNPMLELVEDDGDSTSAESSDDGSTESLSSQSDQSVLTDLQGAEPESLPAGEWDETMPNELPVDTQWDDLLPSSSAPARATPDGAEMDFDQRNSAEPELQDLLLWQLNLTRLSDVDRVIALSIIDSVDNMGRLNATPEEIHESLELELEIDLDEVVAVLHALQQFEPAGVCARDLQECLMIQLKQLPSSTQWLEQAKQMVSRHMSQLASGDFAQIQRRMRLKEDQLIEVMELVQSLKPFPGEGVGADATEYVVPDVFVSKQNGRWQVNLNPDIAPRIRINEGYAGMIRRADNSADNNYLRDNLQEAKWFLKSLQSRNETLMKVATRIVEHQRNFLEYGEEAMKPLVLHDIAEAVEMHESTISRVTTRKYMHTPRGIFELKYFFSSHVATTSGGECSSTAIRALIKKLVAAENPRKPLSDNKITQLLEDQGIKVARRTVAKYRDTLFIPPSNERKRLV